MESVRSLNSDMKVLMTSATPEEKLIGALWQIKVPYSICEKPRLRSACTMCRLIWIFAIHNKDSSGSINWCRERGNFWSACRDMQAAASPHWSPVFSTCSSRLIYSFGALASFIMTSCPCHMFNWKWLNLLKSKILEDGTWILIWDAMCNRKVLNTYNHVG